MTLTDGHALAYIRQLPMKTVPILVVIMALTASVRSQDAETTASSRPTVTPVVVSTNARILGNIPDGTPPPHAPVKPAVVVPAENVLESTAHEEGGRTITIQRIKPIVLPPPPEPQIDAAAAPIDNAAFKQRLAEYRAAHPRTGMLSIGATVYRFNDSPPRTLIRYWPGSDGDCMTFWSSADFSLISGIHSFVATDGKTRNLFMSWYNMDTTRIAAMLASRGRQYQPPVIPTFPAGPATFTIVGTLPAAPSVLVPIQSLHDLYNSEFQRLKAAYDGREAARLQREAELKAHPPQPKDIVVNYWRTAQPAPVKGGSK
jgi:hypothetical protein